MSPPNCNFDPKWFPSIFTLSYCFALKKVSFQIKFWENLQCKCFERDGGVLYPVFSHQLSSYFHLEVTFDAETRINIEFLNKGG